MKFYDKTC